MKKILFFSLAILVLFSSCRKDVNDPSITPPEVIVDPGILVDYEPTVIPVTGSVDGFITDENGDAIQGAQVKLGSQTTVTNEDGHFAFLNKGMNKAGTLIQVTHMGYFDGSRRFIPNTNGVDRVRIQLLQKVFDQSVDAATGGAVSIPGGTGTIDFSANTIVDANGSAYTGTVDIAVKYLDPSAEITSEQMPGDLFGVNEELEERMLATYGMIAVELVDANGNPLNIGANSTATITMPVPASMQGNAPATIPLWSYNEAYGVWVEEGEATLTNGAYVGEVTHFSWWNCDVPTEYVTLTATLTDHNGDPLNGYTIKLISTNFGTGHGTTNSLGVVTGIVPAGEVLTAEILACTLPVHSQNIGPFTNPFSTVSITANTSTLQKTEIVGTVECNGTLLNDYLMVVSDGNTSQYTYGSSSTINWNRLYCGSGTNYTLKLANPATQEESSIIPITAGALNNIGTVDACQNTLTDYLLLDFDGNSFLVVDSIGVYGNNNVTSVYASHFDQQSYISLNFTFDGLVAGSYPGTLNGVNIYFNSNTSNYNGTGEMTSFDITSYTSTKITGSFSGTVIDNQGVIKPISSSFDLEY